MRTWYRYPVPLILAVYLVIIAVPDQAFAAPLTVAVLGGLIVVAQQSQPGARLPNRMAWITAASFLVVVGLIAVITGRSTALNVVTHAATAMMCVYALVILVRAARSASAVDSTVISGVLSVYLLLALVFASVHALGSIVSTHYLAGGPATTPELLYFSIITITTVGYGDLVPGNHLAQGISAVEALSGQLYLASIVALVVGRYRGARG